MIENSSVNYCPNCKFIIFVQERDNEGRVECIDWKCKWNNKHPDSVCKPVGIGYHVYPDQFVAIVK